MSKSNKITKEYWLSEYKQTVNIHKFLNDGHDVVENGERNVKENDLSDYISYCEFLKYFSTLKENAKPIDKHNLIIGINFAYGWMPTLFHFKFKDMNVDFSNDLNNALTIIEKASEGEDLTEYDLIELASLFNNSLVGTSKLLHFIDPKKFAIIDSRVWYYLTGKGDIPENHRERAFVYLAYLDLCNEILKDENYNNIHLKIEKIIGRCLGKAGYKMSELRTIELIMYTKGKKGDSTAV